MRTKRWQGRLLAAMLCTALLALWMPVAGLAAEGKTVYLKNTGSDANDGSTAAQAVQTLDKALELAGNGGTILMASQIWVYGEKTIENVTVARAEGYDGTMLSVGSGAQLTVRNATIDGKNGGGDGKYLISVNSKGTLHIADGATLQNNEGTAVSLVGGTLNMTGGVIRSNTSVEDGGGVYLWDAKAVFSGGVIEGNETDRCGGGICALGASDVTLSGTAVCNNTSHGDGGGVYVEANGNSDAKFTMTGGSITGNQSPEGYAGLVIANKDYAVDAAISGGTISGNTDQDGEDTSIRLCDYFGSNYPVLKLSGAPSISGRIDLWDESETGAYLEIVGAFNPPSPLSLSDVYGTEGRAVVRYAEGLTPDLGDFTTTFTNTGFRVNGQNIEWLDLIRVRVYSLNEAGKYTSERVYVYPNQPIDQSKLPAPIQKTGYSMTGYQYKEDGAWKVWDLSAPITQQMDLYELWTLNAPTAVEILADTTKAHPGQTITLKAGAAHELEGMVYNYAWYKDGVLIDGANEAVLAVTEPGSYTVKISVYNGKVTSAEAESAAVVCEFGHFTDSAWQHDDHNHWQVCTVCGEKLNLGAHISDEGKVTTEATETTEGVKTYSCTACGKVLKTEAIPVLASPDGANGVKTGDLSQGALWTALLALAAAGMGGTVLYRKKHNA